MARSSGRLLVVAGALSVVVSGASGASAVGGGAGCARSDGLTTAAPADAAVGAGAGAGEGDTDEGGTATVESLCRLPVSRTLALDGARPYAPLESVCVGDDAFCDSADAPPDPQDRCFVANQNLARAERQSRASARGAPAGSAPWDGTTAPLYLDRIDAHYHLTASERQKLHAHGFVVLDRLAYVDYASAFHDIFQEQLPLYVAIDPILHAAFREGEQVLETLERKELHPALTSLLAKLRSGLRAAKGRLDPQTLGDLDVYLGVAFALAHPPRGDQEPKLSLFGHDDEVRELVSLAGEHQMTDPDVGIALFGRQRVIDFSQFEPRGHYAPSSADGEGEPLSAYFEAMMWLSRLELNLVSRSSRSSQPGTMPDPAETPREATLALALAEVAAASGALTELAAFDRVYGSFAGRREDVTVPDLLALERTAHLRSTEPRAAATLKAAIGDRFQRTARTHFMPAGSTVLPAIATLLGPRVVPDVAPLTHLIGDRVPGRQELGAADVGYVLGHDRARAYLQADLAAFPRLQAELDTARRDLRTGAAGTDVYASWLRTVLAVGAPLRGTVPSFFAGDAYQDRRLDAALVGFGQLRHAFVLAAAQGYDEYGCAIPDAYVEPQPAFWDALAAHVQNVRAASPAAFAGLVRVVDMLRDIARTESEGAPLAEAQRRWLAMVSEFTPSGGADGESGQPPKWTGWYFDLFADREIGAGRTAAFVADYFTVTSTETVKYLGADGPRLGIFVVDVGGRPRAMVGPVAKGYEMETSTDERLDDEQALASSPAAGSAPWRASFAEPPAADLDLGIEGRFLHCAESADASAAPSPSPLSPEADPDRRPRLAVRARRPVGDVTVTLLDHHGDPLGPGATVALGPSWQIVQVELPPAFATARSPVAAVQLHVADLAVSGLGKGSFDVSSAPGIFEWNVDQPDAKLPQRWRGAGDFVLGRKEPALSAAPRP